MRNSSPKTMLSNDDNITQLLCLLPTCQQFAPTISQTGPGNYNSTVSKFQRDNRNNNNLVKIETQLNFKRITSKWSSQPLFSEHVFLRLVLACCGRLFLRVANLWYTCDAVFSSLLLYVMSILSFRKRYVQHQQHSFSRGYVCMYVCMWCIGCSLTKTEHTEGTFRRTQPVAIVRSPHRPQTRIWIQNVSTNRIKHGKLW